MNNLFNSGKSNNKKMNNTKPNNSNKSNFGLSSIFGNNKSNNTRSNNSTNVKVNYNAGRTNNMNRNGFEIENIVQYILMVLLAILIIYVFAYSVKYMLSNEHPKKPYFTYLFGMDFSNVYSEDKPEMNKLEEIKQKIQANISFDDEGSIKATPSDSSPLDLFDRKILNNKKEVFIISDNIFTYDDAQCLCKSIGAELASKSQLIDAYNIGMSSDVYAWTENNEAYYIVQPCDAKKNGKKPGLNGGYFAPNNRFGVACYGEKKQGRVVHEKEATCDKGEQCDAKKFNAERIKQLNILPFNKDSWSQYNNN
jgi:hypothetical protein